MYVKRRLCGMENCKNESDACRSVTFPRIPKDSPGRCGLRKKWLLKIPRENIPLSSHSCVCSVHFVGGACNFRDGDVPQIFEGRQVLPQARSTRTSMGLDALKSPKDSALPNTRPELDRRAIDDSESSTTRSDEPRLVTVLEDHHYTKKSADLLQHTVEEQAKRIAELEGRIAALQGEVEKCRKELSACKLSFETLKTDPTVFKFYTGITIETFGKVKTLLGTAPERMDYTGTKKGEHDGKCCQYGQRKLPLDDELLLVLVKLRHDFPESDLANRFGVSQPTVSRIFSTWILCMFATFKEIPIWPSRELVDRYMPTVFKDKYPSTRAVIDATEFKIEKPANPDVQATTWSSYKNCNTLKLLVGVTPNGVISFLSSLWGGRISDKQITSRSGLLERLEKGDSIMADRGFDIADDMPSGTAVNIPPFLEANVQFDEADLVATRRIASLRIHVERAIERIKNFQITHFFPASLCPLAEEIIYVCAFLTLFEPPLVPAKAAD